MSPGVQASIASKRKNMADSRRDIASSLGFSSWSEMLPLLYRDHSSQAIASLVGFDDQTIRRDLKKMGVQIRGRGGANYRGIAYHSKDQMHHRSSVTLKRVRRVCVKTGMTTLDGVLCRKCRRYCEHAWNPMDT